MSALLQMSPIPETNLKAVKMKAPQTQKAAAEEGLDGAIESKIEKSLQ